MKMEYKKISKKGQAFEASIVVVTLLILVTLGTTLSLKTIKIEKEGDFGEFSVKVFDAYKHKQSILFELDSLATYAALETTYDLAKNAGLDPKKCTEYDKYILVDTESENCSPTKHIRGENFLILFRDKMPGYLKLDEHLNLLTKEYNYTLDQEHGLTIVGDLSKKMPMQKPFISYTIHPPFTIQLNYDMKDYSRLITNSRSLIKDCESNDTPKKCVEDKIKKYNWTLAQDQIPEDRIFKFNAPSNKKYLSYDKLLGKTELKPVTINFALEMPLHVETELRTNQKSYFEDEPIEISLSFTGAPATILKTDIELFFEALEVTPETTTHHFEQAKLTGGKYNFNISPLKSRKYMAKIRILRDFPGLKTGTIISSDTFTVVTRTK
ncbi:hypothetical protein ACFLYT_01355 [Nanoarchaeota archaeon]